MTRLQQKWHPFLIVKVMTVVAAALAVLLWSQKTHAELMSTEVALQPDRTVTIELAAPATGIAATLGSMQPVEVQVQEHGTWSAWTALTIDNDAFAWERNSQLIITDDATAVRLRSPSATTLILHSIAVEDVSSSWEEVAAGRQLVAPVIIPRWQWGADETLRVSKRGAREVRRLFEEHDPFLADRIRHCDRRAYLYPDEFREVNRVFTNDDGETLMWPQGYSREVHLVVVHHTAESSPNGSRTSDIERMRAVYEYHTVGRGWGDIGYNFAIGPNGTIFEGRAGGDYVVGAHAYCNNVGTMGIALMGNFQTGKPTDQQLTALNWLLVHLSDTYGIDPDGRVIHHGKTMPSIVGHRDVGQTACPGNYSHELLPQLRLAAKERDISAPLFSSVAIASAANEAALMASLEPVTVTMGQRERVEVRYMNVSSDTWNNRTWLLAQGDPGVFFTEFSPFSYVAGFVREQAVLPGEIATFEISLQGGLTGGEGSVLLTPVVNNERRLIENTTLLPFTVRRGNPQFTHVTQYFPNLHKVGEDLTGTIKMINSGNVPWERDTITQIEFDVDGGTGEVSVLNHPASITPGEQASFRLSLQNVEANGLYKRQLLPRFLEGSRLVGNTIELASHAEPIPDIALISANAGPPSLIAEARLSASQSHDAAPFLPSHRRPYTEADGVLIEALAGTELTLSPREQATIPIRIRAGKDGVTKFQPIAPVVRSNPTIILRDETSLRLRNTFRSPVSLRRFQTHDMEITIIAPRQEGNHTFSLGNIRFGLTVNPSGRFTIRKSPPRQLTRRATVNTLRDRRAERRARFLRNAPPPIVRDTNDTYIRIRLGYDKQNAILSAESPMRIEGDGRIIFAEGPIHLNPEQGLCKVTTSNGGFLAPAIRLTPSSPAAVASIMTLERRTNRFRGTLECRVLDGKFTLINDLPMEQYLAGLAEEPDSEPFEKQRAFAIAARSYATFYVVSGQRKFPGKPYDGSDSPAEFQAYGGVYFEEQNPRWVEAVKDTRGTVLTWERKVIKAPYFSQDDGNTKSAYDVWGWTHTPFLESKPDPWCIGLINWGHGVGMSGCGSEGQANEGKSAEEILEYYYPGTRLLPIRSLSPQ
jgi:hypothetical protein